MGWPRLVHKSLFFFLFFFSIYLYIVFYSININIITRSILRFRCPFSPMSRITIQKHRDSCKRIADRDKYFIGSQRHVGVLVVWVKNRVVISACVRLDYHLWLSLISHHACSARFVQPSPCEDLRYLAEPNYMPRYDVRTAFCSVQQQVSSQ